MTPPRPVLAALGCLAAVGAALAQPAGPDPVVAEAEAAIASTFPAGQAPQFRGIGSWDQRPGEYTVCGEVGTSGPDPAWRAFLSFRRPDGWHYRANPTATTAAEMRRCQAEIARPMHPPDGSPPSKEAGDAAFPDLERRCPMTAIVFWTDHAMVCAGHAR